ncbi:PREDICTED: CUE domain-containing protein 1 [Pygoscelis adeliae]|uniref:CUE domain-containing protein 1 n=1 Tax=Pygoscelis adeliae TaxID=9238 RepID=UPI0004F4E135|nr:PREDICTED: CUE domain-containing protein 1 [Pygoscelis adeliae]
MDCFRFYPAVSVQAVIARRLAQVTERLCQGVCIRSPSQRAGRSRPVSSRAESPCSYACSSILERTLEPDSSDEEPPPVYSPPAYESQATDVPGPGSTLAPGCYRNWNPPLLGNLPEDFLRILPQQTAGAQGSHGCRLAPRGQGSLEQERRWKQYLEDERIALFLQNEEFMKELQRNRDFLLALERDRLKYESKKSKSTSVAVSSDFGFSSVISATRKKLFELARAFSEKTKMRKSKRKHLLKHQMKTSKHGSSSCGRRRRRRRKGSKWSQCWGLLLAQNVRKAS